MTSEKTSTHIATTLLAKENTWIKQFPVANGTLPPNQKHFLSQGESLTIVSYEKDETTDNSLFNEHYKVLLSTPINTFAVWYVYIPHVTIS